MKKNKNLYTKKCKEIWKTSVRYLALPYERQNTDVAPDTKASWNKKMIDASIKLSTISGPVIVYCEKKTKLGEWIFATLTKEHFDNIKKQMK